MSEIAFVLGTFVAAGGTIGYLRTGSIPSIAAGALVGALYLYSGVRLRAGDLNGHKIALAASVVLAGSSIPRAIKTGKGLPIGLAVLAVGGLGYYGEKVLNTGPTKLN